MAGGRRKSSGRSGRDGPDELFWLLVAAVCLALVALRRAWPGMRDRGGDWWAQRSGTVIGGTVVLLLVAGALLAARIAIGRRRRRDDQFPDAATATAAASVGDDPDSPVPPLPDVVGPFTDLPVVGFGAAPVLRYAVARGGDVQGWDLGGPDAHCLVVGRPGSGKTNLLLAMAVEAFRQGVEVLVVDPRRLGLVGLRGRPGVSWVATDVAGMAELVTAAHAEMERRYRVIEDRKAGLDRGRIEELGPILVVVDDLAFLADRLDADPDHRRREADVRPSRPLVLLQEMAVMGGATDLHLLVSVSGPDVDVLSPSMRDRLGHRVALNQLSRQEEMVLWGSSEAGVEMPPRPGRGMASAPFAHRHVQCVMMPDLGQWPSLIVPLHSTIIAARTVTPASPPTDPHGPGRTIPRE